MPDTIPCPNPTCPHDFSQAELQAASAVECPKCGFRMQGRGPAQPPPRKPAAAKPPSRPAAKPAQPAKPTPQAKPLAPATPRVKVVMTTPAPPQPKASGVQATIPLATPVAAAPTDSVPLATPIAPSPALETEVAAGEPQPNDPGAPIESAANSEFFNTEDPAETGALVRTGFKSGKKFSWQRLFIYLCALGFAASIVIVAVAFVARYFIGPRGRELASSDGAIHYNIRTRNVDEEVFKLVLPVNEWATDSEIKAKFGALAAWKNVKEYEVWFAVVVKDYGMLKPRDAEMVRLAIDKVEKYYESVELGATAERVQPEEIPSLPPAQKLRFKGTITAGIWHGECYMFFQSGVAYWLFIASPDKEVVDWFGPVLPDKNFSIVSERRGWREQPPPIDTFTSENGKVVVTAPKDVWNKHNVKDDYQNGEMYLFGRSREKDNNRKNAAMLLVTLEKKGDLKESLKAAREFFETKEGNATAKIVHAADVAKGQAETGAEMKIEHRTALMLDLKLQAGDEPQRYYLLVVVNEAALTYVIRFECDWKEGRQIWRQDFLDLLGKVQIK